MMTSAIVSMEFALFGVSSFHTKYIIIPIKGINTARIAHPAPRESFTGTGCGG